MYELFTDRARKLMQFANQEAKAWNHEYIGTEHLALALFKTGDGTANKALESIKCDVGKVRSAIESAMQRGPDMVTMGKLPQTPRSKQVIEFAMDEARKLNHNYVGTEHVLLGLLRADGIAGEAFNGVGVDADVARKAVLELLGGNAVVAKVSAILGGKSLFVITDSAGVTHEYKADKAELDGPILKIFRGMEVVAMFAQWGHCEQFGNEWTTIAALSSLKLDEPDHA